MPVKSMDDRNLIPLSPILIQPTPTAQTVERPRKIVLVRVPEDFDISLQEIHVPYESMGLGIVAAGLREQGHHVTIIDGTLLDITSDLRQLLTPHFKEHLAEQYIQELAQAQYGLINATDAAWLVRRTYMAQQILAEEPDLVGFSLISSLVYGRVVEMIALLRDLGLTAPTCAGGEQASLYADNVMMRIAGLDACVRAEGDFTAPELVRHLEDRAAWAHIPGLTWRDGDRIVHNPVRPLVRALDSLPLAARDTLPAVLERGGDALMVGSRGCVYNCSFCSIIEFYNAPKDEKWRYRDVEALIQEIRYLYTTFGADRFWFVDDIFFGSGESGRLRADHFFRRVIEEKLPIRYDVFCRANDLRDFSHIHQASVDIPLAVRAGLRRTFIGIESGSQKVLKEHFTKGTTPKINLTAINRAERAGVDVLVEFIMFNPFVTLEQIEENLSFLKAAMRGTGKERGKYDPFTLSSKLYIHRETPLGRAFFKSHFGLIDVEAMEKIGDDFYVPYVFECPRVGALSKIIEEAWKPLSPVAKVLEQLYRLVDRFWLPEFTERTDREEISLRYVERRAQLDALRRIFDDETLAFFKEALSFVKRFDIGAVYKEENGRKFYTQEEALNDAAYGRIQKMKFEAENVATYLYSSAIPVLEQVWLELQERGLQGRRALPPSVLSDAMPEHYGLAVLEEARRKAHAHAG